MGNLHVRNLHSVAEVRSAAVPESLGDGCAIAGAVHTMRAVALVMDAFYRNLEDVSPFDVEQAIQDRSVNHDAL